MTPRTGLAAALGALLVVAAFALYIGAQASRLDEPGGGGPGGSTGSAAAAASSQGSAWAPWARREDGTPVRWDPCSPIRWVYDPRGAPTGGQALVEEAMRRVGEASGLDFELVGRVTEQPATDRPLVGPDGDWNPVLVAWAPGGATDLPLGDRELGLAVPVAVRDGGPPVFVTGQVVLNADRPLLPDFRDRHGSWGAVLVHEIGHLVGLDHVDDPTQLMAPSPGFGPVELGAGDRAGLAAVGRDAGCLAVPPPQELDVTIEQ